MLELFRTKGNTLFKLLLLLFAAILYLSALAGMSYIMLSFSILVVILLPFSKLLDKTGLFLVLFSLFYSFLLLLKGPEIRILVYLLCPGAFYVFGRYLSQKLSYKGIIDFILLTILLFGLRTYLATIVDVSETGIINPIRTMNRSGSGDGDMAATLFGLNVSLGFVGLSAYFVKPKVKVPLYFTLLVSFCLSTLTVVHLINRTGLILIVLCTTAVLMYYSVRKAAKIFAIVGVALILAFIFIPALQSIYADINEAYSLREINEAGEAHTFGDRLWRWEDAIKRIFTDPLGWDGRAQYNYAHNLWLDVARQTGIIPFILLLVSTILGSKKILFLARRHKADSLVALLGGIMVVMLISAFMEPVMEGFDLYFYLMCLFWGIASNCDYLIPENELS